MEAPLIAGFEANAVILALACQRKVLIEPFLNLDGLSAEK